MSTDIGCLRAFNLACTLLLVFRPLSLSPPRLSLTYLAWGPFARSPAGFVRTLHTCIQRSY